MTRQLCFIHIPKTAGTTIASGLASSLVPGEKICPATSFAGLISLCKNVDINTYQFFHGHFTGCILKVLGCNVEYFTVLRDPLSRAISDYNYISSQPDHPLHHLVIQKVNFDAFISDRMTFKHNSMTLSLGTDVNPFEIIGYRRLFKSGKPIDQEINEAIFEIPATDRHLLNAIRVLDACVFVGIQERMDETSYLMAEIIGGKLDGRTPSLNVSPKRADLQTLPEEVIAKFKESNKLDYILYDVAARRMERDLASLPARVMNG